MDKIDFKVWFFASFQKFKIKLLDYQTEKSNFFFSLLQKHPIMGLIAILQ